MSQPSSDWMSRVSRRKLTQTGAAVPGTRDTLTLHRWVLLKNLVTASSSSASATQDVEPAAHPAASSSGSPVPPFEAAEQDVFVWPDVDIFEFPDAATLTAAGAADEAAWLDALLDEFDEDDDEFDVSETEDESASITGSVTFPHSSPAPPSLTLPISIASHHRHSSRHSPSPPPSSPFLSDADPYCSCTTPPLTPSSSPTTPSLLDDLPCSDQDTNDDISDDESEGPETPMSLSTQYSLTRSSSLRAASEPAVVEPEPESDSYFFRQPVPRPLLPSSSPFPLQEC